MLILVGGIVRGTGAGMGCPDWPRCFGRWVPPTAESQLPADYKETYRQGRIAKNRLVATRLERMGFHGVAENIFRHPASFIETDFNVTKTWIEYANRLVGVLIGLLITFTFAYSGPLWRTARVIPLAAGLALLTVGVQGWLGSLVVSTNLVPALVTWHMALALVLLALLHYAYWRSEQVAMSSKGLAGEGATTALIAWSFVGLVFGQIILGTQVRENIDVVASQLNYLNRDLWIERLGPTFNYHRALTTLLLLLGVLAAFRAWTTARPAARRAAAWVGVLLVLNPLVGFALATFAVPAWLQPVHLLVGTGLFGASVVLGLAVGATGLFRNTSADGPQDSERVTVVAASANGV